MLDLSCRYKLADPELEMYMLLDLGEQGNEQR
jgi:hypothetical protein